ncbi:MAG: hypothetical protein U1D29_12835 [Burkholderiales bacterium]|nr:hypothetical protein [Burkholderiales bacterium]
MNAVELSRFVDRLERFTDRGLTLADAGRLADRLVTRDREGDDRRTCLECAALNRNGACSNWRKAGIAIRAGDVRLPDGFKVMLQRCEGFNP